MKRLLALLLCLCAFLAACRTQNIPDPTETDGVPTDSEPTTSPDTEIPESNPTSPDTDPADPAPPALDIVLSEVMPDNKYLVLGHETDWVEIHNREQSAVSLDGYFLTDDPEKPYDLSLTGKTIPADGYLVVLLPEDAAFRLSSLGETVYLTYKGEAISSIPFPLSDGESFDGTGACLYPTPGYPNTEQGYLSYLDSLTLPDLILSEAVTSNKKLMPLNGECYDIIELHNRSASPINLGEYTLTDKRKEPNRFVFPNVTLGAGEFYLIYCSGEPTLGENHTSFKLSSAGETIYLSKNGSFVDAMVLPGDIKSDCSYGRSGNRLLYLDAPTLGEANSGGYLTSVASPTADRESGLYDLPVTVTLSGEGTIHYTLDGSRPTAASPIYTSPLYIEGVTTLRAVSMLGDKQSAPTAYTYVIGTNHSLPIVTVAIPQDKLTGSQGILNHIDLTYEYEAQLTLIEDGEEKFSVPFGFRLHGNDSRKGAKQNFQLRFRSDYGLSKLEYALFDNRPFTEYNSLLLKGGSEDYPTAMIRDELATSLVDGTTNLYAQAIKPVILYLGGEYHGVYYLRERYSDDYAASHLNVSEESIDLLYIYGTVEAGSDKDYQALLSYIKKNDMSTPEAWEYLCEKIDVLSLMDWYICRSYMGDKDLANVRYFRSSESDGKWRWCYFDLDWAFWHTTDRPLTSIVENASRHQLILAIFKSAEGRDAFLRRYAELMGSILNEKAIIARIDSLAATLRPEMERDRERWGSSMTRWENALESLRAYVRGGARDRNVLSDLQNYFSLTDAEMTAYFGEKASA